MFSEAITTGNPADVSFFNLDLWDGTIYLDMDLGTSLEHL